MPIMRFYQLIQTTEHNRDLYVLEKIRCEENKMECVVEKSNHHDGVIIFGSWDGYV